MNLHDAQKHWERWGQEDPMFAIVTQADKRGNRWDVSEFFATGEKNVAGLLAGMAGTGVPAVGQRALDFGCGLGRLTQALAGRFTEVHGVDIAESMVSKARQLNQHGDRVQYHVNATSDLSRFPSGHFDLVFSFIVLQHIELVHQMAYVGEFLRVLRPGGGMVIQVVEGRIGRRRWRDAIQRLLPGMTAWYQRRRGRSQVAEMHAFPAAALDAIVRESGATVARVIRADDRTNEWKSATYGIVKA